MRKAAPPSSPAGASILPPCDSMIDWQMFRPMPIPFSLVVTKGWKSLARISGGNPGPVSRMVDDGEIVFADRGQRHHALR